MASRNGQGTSDENRGDPVAFKGRSPKTGSSPYGENTAWRSIGGWEDNVSDNNAHNYHFPQETIVHDRRR